MKFRFHSKTRSIRVFDAKDFIEIVFGVIVGLLFFLGGSELWNIGAVLNDWATILIVLVNFIVLYYITKLISGKMKKETLFLESVKYPLWRSFLVYIIGFIISFSIINSLNNTGLLKQFVVSTVPGIIPMVIKITIFANLLATLIGLTVDLSIVE